MYPFEKPKFGQGLIGRLCHRQVSHILVKIIRLLRLYGVHFYVKKVLGEYILYRRGQFHAAAKIYVDLKMSTTQSETRVF